MNDQSEPQQEIETQIDRLDDEFQKKKRNRKKKEINSGVRKRWGPNSGGWVECYRG